LLRIDFHPLATLAIEQDDARLRIDSAADTAKISNLAADRRGAAALS
jgi:hypothetical protein